MPREEAVRTPLDGIVLPDARTGSTVDLGALQGVWVLTAIRHRY
jgi:hypothetical protein